MVHGKCPHAALLLSASVALAADRYETRAQHDPNGIGVFYQGREIAHVMGHQAAGWLERPERQEEERTDLLIEALKLQPGEIVADIGAGTGYISEKMARKVGDTGLVYAEDIQQEMIDLLNRKLQLLRLKNVKPVLGTITDPKLPPAGVDLIIMVDVYHEFDHPYEMTENMLAALKPGGRLVFVEFRGEDPSVPIKLVHKMTEAQVKKGNGRFSPTLAWGETLDAPARSSTSSFSQRRSEPARRLAAAALCWRKLSSAKWSDSWLERLSYLGPTRAMVIEFPGARTVRVEAHGLTEKEAAALTKMFGGKVTAGHLAHRQNPPQRAPIRVRGRLLVVSTEREWTREAGADARHAHPRRHGLRHRRARHHRHLPAHAGRCQRARCAAAVGSARSRHRQRHPRHRRRPPRRRAASSPPTSILTPSAPPKKTFAPIGVKVQVQRSDVRQWEPERAWPVVTANLFSGLLIEVAPKIARALAPAGTLIFSGVLREQEAEVLAALAAQKLRLDAPRPQRQMDRRHAAPRLSTAPLLQAAPALLPSLNSPAAARSAAISTPSRPPPRSASCGWS